jgi:hypothetical protein
MRTNQPASAAAAEPVKQLKGCPPWANERAPHARARNMGYGADRIMTARRTAHLKTNQSIAALKKELYAP